MFGRGWIIWCLMTACSANPGNPAGEARGGQSSAQSSEDELTRFRRQLTAQPATWQTVVDSGPVIAGAWKRMPLPTRWQAYQEWSLKHDALVAKLGESGDFAALEKLAAGELPAWVAVRRDDAHPVDLRTDERWLAKTLHGLPQHELDYLRWRAGMIEPQWFNEGMLEVEVPVLVTAYQRGVVLLANDSFRQPDIAKRLDSIFDSLTMTLLNYAQGDPPYTRSAFERDLRSAFFALSASKRHGEVAKRIVAVFPQQGLPKRQAVESIVSPAP